MKEALRWSRRTTSASPRRWIASCGCTRAGSNEWSLSGRRGRSAPDATAQSHCDRAARRLVVLLLLLVVYFASSGNPDQDKLTDSEISRDRARGRAAPKSDAPSKATYDLIKRELFRRAAQLRGSDQAAFDRLAAYAVAADGKSGARRARTRAPARSIARAHCRSTCRRALRSVGGRRTLTSDVDYTVQPAADGSGNVVLLAQRRRDHHAACDAGAHQRSHSRPPTAATENVEPRPSSDRAPVSRSRNRSGSAPRRCAAAATRPSFNCANARTRGEIAVCSDAGLPPSIATWPRNIGRAMAPASPEQQRPASVALATASSAIATAARTMRCIGDAYAGRMREIRDIMEGRWQPPR